MPTSTKPAHAPATVDVDASALTAAAQSAVDDLAATAAAQSVQMIAPTLIHAHPNNPRKDVGDLTELIDSIRAHGILQPITVVPHPDRAGEYLNLLGHRRHASAVALALPFVPVVVRVDLDAAAQLAAMLVENLQRSDLNVIEEGAGYQGLLDLGVKRQAIAKHTGRAVSTVTQRLKIAGLPEGFHSAVLEHQLTLEEAVSFADLREEDAEEYDATVAKLAGGFASGSGVLMRGALSRANSKRRIADAVEHWKGRGWDLRVDENTADLPDDALPIRPWEGLRWTPADHEATGCEHGIAFCQSSWMTNVEAWGRFWCVKPEVHADRLAQLAELEASKQQTVTPVVSAEEAERRAREDAISEDLAEAALSRARFLCGVFQGTSEADKARQQLLIAHAIDVTLAGETDPSMIDMGVDVDVLENAVEMPFNGVDAVGRLALAVLTIPERLMPFTHWDYDPFTSGHGHPVAVAHLRLLKDLGHPLSQWEERLLEELTGVADQGADEESA